MITASASSFDFGEATQLPNVKEFDDRQPSIVVSHSDFCTWVQLSWINPPHSCSNPHQPNPW